jgi:penicillin-binding protein 2
VILIIFSILFISFARLQIGKREQYIERSINNSIRKVQVNPVRGLIFDKKSKLLVDTRASFSIAAIPQTVSDSALSFVCDLLKLDKNDISDKIKKRGGFRPIIISRDISFKEQSIIEENKLNLPGIVISSGTKRFYSPGVYSPHIFGSMGEVNKADELLNNEYEEGDLVGKTGVEKKYDLDLRGTKGYNYVQVDVSGKELGFYDESQNIPPKHGNNLYLHMDYQLQQFAESLLVDQRGAVVLLDTKTGGILTFVSKPDFDPRHLSGKIEHSVWDKLLNDPNHPLYNRAIQSGYPPGSTYKIIAAIAALEEGIITADWKTHCPGFFKLGRKNIHCWNHSGHGTINLNEAIKGSCNVYFFKLGLKIGLETWSKYSKIFRFGFKTGIDIPNENKGLVPTRDYFNKVFGENGWTKGNLANLAIGQGELLTTPLQIAQFAMILANKGIYHPPHLIEKMYDFSEQRFIQFPVKTTFISEISDKSYNIVREGMRQVVNGGTGELSKIPGIEMAGKTGSAQNPHGETHAWFMAFAPYERPEVAISVILENAGGGGAVAAPVARKILEMYFFGKLLPRKIEPKSPVELNSDSLITEPTALRPHTLNPTPLEPLENRGE